MYQNIYFENRKQKVHLWDDKKGYITFPYKKYAYIKHPQGMNYTLDGERVKKIYKWEPGIKGLYESDVPQTTRVLVDQYTDSDEPSVGHRKLFFDIEVEVTEGFPDVMKALNMITSIALYDDITSTYFTFVNDPKKQIENYEKDYYGLEEENYCG